MSDTTAPRSEAIHRLPLRIDFGEGKPTQPFPVRGGLPFAQGALLSTDQVRLLVDEAEHPCQIKQTAVWPDGSVKWLLLDFMATVDQAICLEYGTRVARQTTDSTLKVTQTDQAVEVDTGRLYVRIERQGSGFVDTLRLDGQILTDAEGKPDRRHILDFVHTDATTDRPTHTAVLSGTPDPSRVVIDTLAVEASGPLHAVVLIRGQHTYQFVGATIPELDEHGTCAFTLRLHLWAGQPLLMAEHFFVYDGNPDVDFIRQVGLRLPMSSVRDATTVAFETDQGIETRPLSHNACGLHQASPDHFEVWQAVLRR